MLRFPFSGRKSDTSTEPTFCPLYLDSTPLPIHILNSVFHSSSEEWRFEATLWWPCLTAIAAGGKGLVSTRCLGVSEGVCCDLFQGGTAVGTLGHMLRGQPRLCVACAAVVGKTQTFHLSFAPYLRAASGGSLKIGGCPGRWDGERKWTHTKHVGGLSFLCHLLTVASPDIPMRCLSAHLVS